jgi:uncharacterized protein (TIGR03790 family)
MRRPISLLCTALASLIAQTAFAGGGPMNVLVVYNADEPKAEAVATHYATARALPKGHTCPIHGVATSATTIDVPTFQSMIQKPVDDCLAALPHPDEIDALVLVRGLPYSVNLPNFAASLQAMLQVGHGTRVSDGMEIAGMPQAMSASVSNPAFQDGYFNPADSPVMNQYSAWYSTGDTIPKIKKQPLAFHRSTVKDGAEFHLAKNLFIVQSLDGFDYTDADALIDRALMSDGSLPKQELLCMHAEDDARGARDPECELTTRLLAGAGFNAAFLPAFDGMLKGHDVMAYFTGSADTVKNAIAGNTFAPGAIAENLTSYGAAIPNFACDATGMTCPASEAQTSVARFIRAGATGAHGTVNEPLNNVFPNAGTLLDYTFGYSMGESFLMNQRFLYWQNVYLGDPLATPYAKRPTVSLGAATHPHNQPIVVTAKHDNGIASIDLFSAGKRVAHADADTLSYEPQEAIGQTLDLLAVAVAKNAPVMRKGWPQPDQEPRPDVQGWTAAMIKLGPDQQGTGGGGAGGGAMSSTGTEMTEPGDNAPVEGGCGCRTETRDGSSSAGSLATLLLTIGFGWRRGSARRPGRAGRNCKPQGRAAS